MQAHGTIDGAGAGVIFDRGDPADWTVVEDADGAIVSTCALLSHRLRLGCVVLPVGRLEYVATAPPHRRNGLIRSQFRIHHRASARRGDLATFVSGIPYFYRRFGYGYAMDYPSLHSLDAVLAATGSPRSAWSVRELRRPDLDVVRRLHESATANADIAEVRDDRTWEDQVHGETPYAQTFLVAERAGRIGGYARLAATDDSEFVLAQATALDADCFGAILAHAEAVSGSQEVLVAGSPCPVVGPILARLPQAHLHLPLYGRIADPLRLLERLRPELDRRLQHARSAPPDDGLDISLYATGLRLHFAGRRIEAIEATSANEYPAPQEVAISPDNLPALVFGRFDPTELARRVDDVQLGRHADLMGILFPRLCNAVFGDL
ncbi:MAG: hypothetical protein JJLCMIEE_02687 [Acidimicrobiales bacterium]|nr:hypothetical protein [Acidimicrobiales bacterium]